MERLVDIKNPRRFKVYGSKERGRSNKKQGRLDINGYCGIH